MKFTFHEAYEIYLIIGIIFMFWVVIYHLQEIASHFQFFIDLLVMLMFILLWPIFLYREINDIRTERKFKEISKRIKDDY